MSAGRQETAAGCACSCCRCSSSRSLATLLGRLWFLQVHDGAAYAAAASANRVREVVTPAPRGEVYDATGAPARAQPHGAGRVSVNRALLLREPGHGAAVLARLAKVVGKRPALLRKEITPCGGTVKPPCWRGSPYQPVPVQEYAADDAAGLRRCWPSRSTARTSRPSTPASPRCASTRAPTAAGRARARLPRADQPGGDAAARSTRACRRRARRPGGRRGEVRRRAARHRRRAAAAGRPRRHRHWRRNRDAAGARRQARAVYRRQGPGGRRAGAEHAIDAGPDPARPHRHGTYGPTPAPIVVMEAKTGACSRSPATRPTTRRCSSAAPPTRSTRPRRRTGGAPLVSRAIQGAFAPASTFKVVSTARGAEDGNPRDGIYPCPGAYAPLGGKRNFEGEAFGPITLRTRDRPVLRHVFYDFAYMSGCATTATRPVRSRRTRWSRMARPSGSDPHRHRPAERAQRHDRRPEYLQKRWERLRANYCRGAVNPARAPSAGARTRSSARTAPASAAATPRTSPSAGRHPRHAAATRHRVRHDREQRQGARAARRPGAALGQRHPGARDPAEGARTRPGVGGEPALPRRRARRRDDRGHGARRLAASPSRSPARPAPARSRNKQDTAWFARSRP